MNKNKLLKISEFADNPELTQFKTILDVDEKIDAVKESVVNIPQPIDHSEKLDNIITKLDEDEEIVVTLNIV